MLPSRRRDRKDSGVGDSTGGSLILGGANDGYEGLEVASYSVDGVTS